MAGNVRIAPYLQVPAAKQTPQWVLSRHSEQLTVTVTGADLVAGDSGLVGTACVGYEYTDLSLVPAVGDQRVLSRTSDTPLE